MAELPNVRLNLANTAENVVVVRAVLSAIAEDAGVGAEDIGDIRTAVTEACNNVVLHAYGGERGPMDIAIGLAHDAMLVTVRDRGVGIGDRAREDPREPERVGLGLHVIRTLSRRVEFDEPPGRGTRVRFEFAARGLSTREPRLTVGPEADLLGGGAELDAAIGLAPVALARAVVPRLTCTLAARAHFSTDRLSDLQLLCDALASHAGEVICEQRLSFGVNVQPRDLELRVAPLRIGSAHGMVSASELDGLGTMIDKLADGHEILAGPRYETLAVNVLDRPRDRG